MSACVTRESHFKLKLLHDSEDFDHAICIKDQICLSEACFLKMWFNSI